MSDWIRSDDYIKDLKFDYMETYSFNRLSPLLKAEYDELFLRRQEKPLSVPDMERFKELGELYKEWELLIDKNGNFHHSSEKMAVFQAHDPEVVRFTEIMNMEVIESFNTLCAPMYRDAIVFYESSGKIVSVLNVCLSCNYMTTGHQNLRADFEVYDLLNKFFFDIGHRVENPHKFDMNEKLRKMKAKFLAKREKKNKGLL
jgi:hypothetical protein